MASASMLISKSQFWPSNFLRKGVMLFDLAQTSKVSHKEVRTIIRKLRSSQNSAVCFGKGPLRLPKGGCVCVLLCSFATPSRAALPYVRIFQIHLKLKRLV